jgi:tRNA pseudouridine synthase 10
MMHQALWAVPCCTCQVAFDPVLADVQVIHSIQCSLVEQRPQWFVLDLVAQAGTYIKEFCHGDFGRTVPSVGDLLGGIEVQIEELDVTHIELDIL